MILSQSPLNNDDSHQNARPEHIEKRRKKADAAAALPKKIFKFLAKSALEEEKFERQQPYVAAPAEVAAAFEKPTMRIFSKPKFASIPKF